MRLNFERKFTTHHMSQVICHVSLNKSLKNSFSIFLEYLEQPTGSQYVIQSLLRTSSLRTGKHPETHGNRLMDSTGKEVGLLKIKDAWLVYGLML